MGKDVEIKLRLPVKLAAQLEEFQFARRFRSRNAAVVSILKVAFANEADREPGLFDSPKPPSKTEGG